MKKYNLNSILFAFLLLVFAWGCSKDIDIFTAYPDISKIQEFPTTCTAAPHDIVGEVINEAGQPVPNTTITVGGVTTTTDKYGAFVVRKVKVKYQHVYIQAEKNGYFNGSRVIVANPKQQNYVKIMLLEKTKTASFDSKIGKSVQVGKASIDFPRLGYKDASGKPYSGEVVVSARYLDPSKRATYLQMPGDLRGLNSKGEPVCLGTYGMVVCELSDLQGNLLNLNGDSTATITYPITEKFQTTQPDNVPLWHFDERLGTWVQEGNSTLLGNNYVGKVKHFSFWNCDYPYGVVLFNATFTDKKGTPLKGLTVVLCFKTGTDSLGINQGCGYTDATGHVSGAIPINQALTMKVFAGGCTTPIYTQNIGSFSADVTLPTIPLDLSSIAVELINIKGQLNDCSGNALKKGYLKYSATLATGEIFDLGLIFCDSVGNINSTLVRTTCAGSAAVDKIIYNIVDLDNLKESTEATKPISVGLNDLGVMTACNQLNEYLIVEDNGVKYILTHINATVSMNDIFVSANSDSTAGVVNVFWFLGSLYQCYV
jgi:hypothetical protein